MKQSKYIILSLFIFVSGLMKGEEQLKFVDNVFMSTGVGFIVGDNGQPASISNVAVAWDLNIGCWLGKSKYPGVRIGYSGDCLQSFNYEGRKVYGWNTIYADAMLNLSTLIYKTLLSKKDPRWYCSPFVSLEALIPMGQNHYHSAFGLGVGIANEINVHKNVSVILDWRNTIAFVDGVKWLPELTAGLRFYFTGAPRVAKPKEKESTPPIPAIEKCESERLIIEQLKKDTVFLNQRINTIESDTTIYHLEWKIVRDYLILNSDKPYNHYTVTRSLAAFQQSVSNEKTQYELCYKQMCNYYQLTQDLHTILSVRQAQLNTRGLTDDRERWITFVEEELKNTFPQEKISHIPYMVRTIDNIKQEIRKPFPNLTSIIKELEKALGTNK